MCQDHPHACGDKQMMKDGISQMTGSSPRVWGQDHSLSPQSDNSGIIPTRVGTRNTICGGDPVRLDHPHACGDKTWTANTIFGIVGSSPRVWGQVYKPTLLSSVKRIIPTRVGTRPFKFSSNSLKMDHPHACGDKFSLSERLRCESGSSPRVWGQEK